MSVRWKPLILLTVLFVVVAAMGLLAITSVLLPGRAEDVLPLARAEAKDGKFDRAKIQYERALQLDSKNAQIHLELAHMLGDWMKSDPAQEQKLRASWLAALQNAAKHGRQLGEPRRLLLADAMRRYEWPESIHWAQELEPIEPDNLDVVYILASDALDRHPPSLDEARGHLARLSEKEPRRDRTRWLQARLARATDDRQQLEATLSDFRQSSSATAPGDPLDRLKLRVLDLEQTSEAAALAERVDALQGDVTASVEPNSHGSAVVEVCRVLQQAQRHIATISRQAPADRQAVQSLGAALAQSADATFRRATQSTEIIDLRPFQGFAEYLLSRNDRARCLEVVAKGLGSPIARAPLWIPTATELREIGIKAALADASDPDRFQKAAPYISDLLASGNARYQALGHLFQGVIELETSGLGQPAKHQSVQPSQANATATTTSVLAHLEAAAEGLKDVPTAQALYGVALVLSREPALGRQYLQDAQRLGGDKLDPRYQIWAAWSLIHAGYPEEAQPIAANLRSELESGRIASDLRPSLHILNAELLEARRTPEALRQARDEYRKAIESGQPRSPQLELRLAQLDAKLGDPEAAMRAIESLSIDPQTGPAAEQLAVITLHQHGKVQKAKERLAAARKSFPDSPGLAGLDASLSVAADKPSDADATLAAYLAAHPGSEELTLYRARVLSGSLGKLDEARSLLCTFAAHSHTSAPLVQLALLDLARKDYSAVTRTISAVRERWSEAATADLLDAQLALARGDATAAASHLQTALTKDPNNKVALFWKARLDEVHGQAAEAQRVFEQILRDRPTKEIDEGLPLASAAQWALATMALEHQEFDTAVSRFESLLSDRQANELARPARWNLAQARAARGETQRALQEVEALLAEPATTLEERVQAADFLRRHGAEAAADRQIEKVLADNPTHAGAITYRAMLLMSHKQLSEAAQLVRTTIDAGKAPAGLYLLLAAIENLAGDSGLARARSAVDEGLAAFPDNLELLRARYQLMTLARDPKALDELEHRLKDPTDAAAQSILLTAYRERRLFEKAITLTESNIADGDTSARQAQILADLILLHIQRAAFSRQQGDSAAAEAALEQARTRLVEARRRFPARTRFVELEGEVALEAGDLPRADLLAQELSDTERGSPAGPILKARIAAAKGMTSDAVSAYEEAVERNPGQSQLRLALARAQLNAGKFDAAVRQTDLVLGAEQDSPAAMVLKAQALAFRKASPREVQANREEAVRLLETVVQKAPGTAEAYHLLSDLYALLGRKDEAIDALKSCRKAFPDDDTAISLLVHRLIQPTDQGQPADPRLVEEAELVASKYAENDDQGMRSLALAVGFHRGGRPDLALPWAEKAAAANSAAVVSLTLGDILLAIAESRPPVEAARPHFERAVEAYTRVLSDEPDSIEAINNKAWILHRYLGQNALALELAESYARRADPDALPAEFLDTLGAIQLAAGKVEEAESSFQDGLRKQPEHPFLNYHMGKAVLERTGDVARARPHLVKALDGKAELPESMAREIAQLLGEPTH